jgi:hypothetical protein
MQGSQIHSVEAALNKMHKNRSEFVIKGTAGEIASLAVLQSLQEEGENISIYHSYSYPYAVSRDGNVYPGNVKLEDGKYILINGREYDTDEIDILLVSPIRIIVIEVKARGGRWTFGEDLWGRQNSTQVDKDPVIQCEKHCRHLYHTIYEALPEGRPEYIQPLTLFVDKASVKDGRPMDIRMKYPLAILNNLKCKVTSILKTPLAYSIDTDLVLSILEGRGSGKLYRPY